MKTNDPTQINSTIYEQKTQDQKRKQQFFT
jgi:hypothetical protein